MVIWGLSKVKGAEECSGEFAMERGVRGREWFYGGMFDAVF